MKTKQLVGIVVTGAVIIAVGVSGVLSNVAKARYNQSADSFMSSLVSTTEKKVSLPSDEFIGVINIVGEIGPSSDNVWSSSSSGYNHNMYLNYIDQMEKSSKNKGILLYVDSPGGTVYESDEMYLRLMEYKENTGRPIWAYFATQACSGGPGPGPGPSPGQIYANRNCWTGSIGVIISLANYKGLYDKLGIKEIDITSGKNKAMGSGGLDLTDEQYAILQSLVDDAYNQFLEIVSEGRRMDVDTLKPIADGRIYTAKQAVDNGLVVSVGSLEDAKTAMTESLSLQSDIKFFEPKNSNLMAGLFSAAEQIRPKSDTELAVEIMENEGKGVLKYYAD